MKKRIPIQKWFLMMMAIATFGTMASGQIANCKNAITLSVDISFCGVTVKVSEIDSSSSDYDQLLISNNLCNGLGIHEVTLTALKFNGNSSTCTTQVNVVDMSAPVPVNKVQLTVELDSNNQYILTPADLDLGSFDNCGNVSLAISESLLDCTTPSPLSVLFTVTDEAGNYNQSICSVTILQNSNRPATLTCKTYTEIEIKRFGFVELTADMILTGGNYACTSFYNFDLSYNKSRFLNLSTVFTPRLISNCAITHVPIPKITNRFLFTTMWTYSGWFATIVPIRLNNRSIIIIRHISFSSPKLRL